MTVSPSIRISPELISSSALTQRSSVDLPEPEAPIRQTTSCRSTLSETPLSTSLWPKDLWTSSISRNAISCHLPAAWQSRSISQSTKRACGIVIRMNRNATTVIGERLNSFDSHSPAVSNASGIAATDSSAVSFCRLMKSLSSGGITRRTACGTSTVRRVCA